jgi:hypothetical protein
MPARTESKGERTLGRRPMPTNVIPFAGIPTLTTIHHPVPCPVAEQGHFGTAAGLAMPGAAVLSR